MNKHFMKQHHLLLYMLFTPFFINGQHSGVGLEALKKISFLTDSPQYKNSEEHYKKDAIRGLTVLPGDVLGCIESFSKEPLMYKHTLPFDEILYHNCVSSGHLALMLSYSILQGATVAISSFLIIKSGRIWTGSGCLLGGTLGLFPFNRRFGRHVRLSPRIIDWFDQRCLNHHAEVPRVRFNERGDVVSCTTYTGETGSLICKTRVLKVDGSRGTSAPIISDRHHDLNPTDTDFHIGPYSFRLGENETNVSWDKDETVLPYRPVSIAVSSDGSNIAFSDKSGEVHTYGRRSSSELLRLVNGERVEDELLQQEQARRRSIRKRTLRNVLSCSLVPIVCLSTIVGVSMLLKKPMNAITDSYSPLHVSQINSL